MTALYDYLRFRWEAGGFSTEDALTAFLPLVRDVLEAHAAGLVAPLEGLDSLHVDGSRIWFEQAQRRQPRNGSAAVRQASEAPAMALEIVCEQRCVTDLAEGRDEVIDLAVGQADAPVTRPVFLPGYAAWEHRLGHHDPLTDIFSLGMILASLVCKLDFHEPDDLARFVAARGNLFALAPDLHPVLARAVFRMTELNRHRRAQDLAALLHHLENYRDQDIDFEFDLARTAGFDRKDRRGKQTVVLGKLKERLFELSRRNRLLHFRPTMHTVNLTLASIPLSFDIKTIRPDQILVWNEALAAAVCGGKPVSLNKYLNFAEAVYLPSVLDRIVAEARRDRAEFGFAQLRLVVCMLHWSNLKEKPIERFESPLVLLPVELKKKKGIRDTYTLEAASPEAEINPVVRHQFKLIYDIDLPERIELVGGGLDRFHEQLQARIEASEPAVSLNKVERPRVALIYDKARRKLDQYRRRARLAGRGVRSFLDVDYSYDAANYHPLGIALFSAKVRPPATHLREILEERPRPRTFAVPSDEPPAVEKERVFYGIGGPGEQNPYVWDFDLCSVTLGNFKYRKMSLVRDYESLLADQPANPAFEATFSLVPRPMGRDLPASPPLAERYDVVPCDPTQATAIEEARAGHSYIIQGPPGTGKSQTITNLIADYVARGKRVLFVCEKRAAIDVVFARLRQCNMADLCCLIHDSQTDKKEFVMDLKQTYERIVEESKGEQEDGRGRKNCLKRLTTELRPLEQFDAAMHSEPDGVGISLRQLLARCVALRTFQPELSPLERERLPNYALWCEHREGIEAFNASVRDLCEDGVLSRHPLRLLSPRLLQVDRPTELVLRAVEAAQRELPLVEQQLARCGIAREHWENLAAARALADYARQMLPLVQGGHFSLLDRQGPLAGQLAQALRKLESASDALAEARSATRKWRQKLPADEVPIALEQARRFERSLMPWLSLGWWRLRAVLRRCYDFDSHSVRPSWSLVLGALEREYAAIDNLNRQYEAIGTAFQVRDDPKAWVEQVVGLQAAVPSLTEGVAHIHQSLLHSDRAEKVLKKAARAGESLDRLTVELDKFADYYDGCSLDRLWAELAALSDHLDELPAFLQCLSECSALPDALTIALRTVPLSVEHLEAAAADRAWQDSLRAQRELARFSAATRQRHVDRLERLYLRWLKANAAEVRRRAQGQLLDNLRLSSATAAPLTPEQRELKRRYARGRRELEHEFGKSMRYKSIRDLVGGDSGSLVKDLKPVWLMSPLSVSDTLPLDASYFDVVIFDEASQITLEEAVPSLFRASQAIVVGDEMQLPPTDFFSAKRDGEDDDGLLIEEEGELVQYDLGSDSFLNHAARNLASTMLGWHYRSRSESLISFSNWAFYDGRLLTVPEERLPAPDGQPPLLARTADDATSGAAELLHRPLSFHFMEHGVYDKRRNRAEADYIAHLVREMLRKQSGLSIGVVAFSEAQQGEIEGALDRLAQADPDFQKALDAEQEREVDGQFVGLLVKNLENIQGDERDIVLLSVCYGRGPNGKMLMNFGPINRSGGEKRLNVAFSRAKHHMAVVSSIRHADITNDYNDGANCLKNYLCYAEAASTADAQTARRVLQGMSRWRETADNDASEHDAPMIDQLARALAQRGFLVDRSVGQSHFRCDLAVYRRGDTRYRLAILLDSQAYYEQSELIERDMMRPKLLRDFGWQVAFVLAKDWYDNPNDVLEHLIQRLEGRAGSA